MCLATVGRTNTKITEGYKVFKRANGRLTSFFIRKGRFLLKQFGCKTIARGKWVFEKWHRIESKLEYIESNSGNTYSIGWHFYHKFEDAEIFTSAWGGHIYKVQVKDVVATGYQGTARVSVCKFMKIVGKEIVPEEEG